VFSSNSLAGENSLIGEWFPVENSDSGLGGTRHFQTNGTLIVTYGAALHYKYQLETNGLTNTVLMPGPKGPNGPPVRMDFTITNDTLTLNERKGRQRDKLTRVKGTSGEGLIGQWTGKHYTGGQQIMDFSTNRYVYLSVPFLTETGSFTLNGNQLTQEHQNKRVTYQWQIADDVLTLTPATGGEPEKYRRKGAAFLGDETAFSDKPDPETEKIEALLKHLETLKDATFVRNDQALDPKEAAGMMRRKWEAQESDIETAAEFIEKIMTASFSGPKKPYLIRFKDGKETNCADFLKAELKKLETTPAVGGMNLTGRLPRGIRITSESKTHVHANISGLDIKDFPALERIHALFTVYFDGQGATDEKLKALTQLRFTNLACVVFTDCPLVTDKGIEYVSQISSVTNLGLRGMSISDAACVTMAARIRLHGVNMPRCTNVTVNGLLKMAQSKTIESLGFTIGRMTQADLIRIIKTAGPQLNRMDIDMDGTDEGRLNLAELRQAATAKSIMLYAVRNRRVSSL
jgi:hypothetical protein